MALKPSSIGKVNIRKKSRKVKTQKVRLTGSSDDPLLGLNISDEDFIFRKPEFMYYNQWCFPLLRIEMLYDQEKQDFKLGRGEDEERIILLGFE